MEIRTGSIFFPSLRGSGPRTATSDIHFARDVEQSVCGLTGSSVGFSGDDHHIGLMDIRVESEVEGDLVRVTGTLGLRDWSGNWDDDYDGVIQFAVAADLVSATDPPPRGDLEITGFELNQATQFFRSFQHLDGATVQPDNAIRLIARKPTGVRVYVDYDASAGLPPITQLSGQLVVTTSIGSATLTLNPTSVITPRPDAAIDRGSASQTLNFVIPEGWCQGELALTCRVFDGLAPTPTSRAFQRTIRFLESAPLRCYLVGVHYTGQGLDLAAPTQAAVLNGLAFVESTYPVPEIFTTGYTAINFDKDMKADIADGCGDGFNDLLDRLRDMRGDSGDVYYAALPPGGIDSGSVGGCGGGGVAATFVGGGATAAQEIGHAFGRDHAPCDDSGRCDNPAHQDDHYPHYNSYVSDSVGEYGYDPLTDTVFDPAATFDFMGYSGGPMWVSPYTYAGLMGAFPVSGGISPAARSSFKSLRAAHAPRSSDDWTWSDREWRRRKSPLLFLRLAIERDHTVDVLPSFSYAALPPPGIARRTGFMIEFRGEDGGVLSCHELRDDCKHCRSGCWPKHIRDAVPLPDGVKEFVVLKGGAVIHEQAIPEPPEVKVRCRRNQKEEIELQWSSDQEGEVWYLVHWLDDDGETWRGVSPRTQEQEMTLPLRQFPHAEQLAFRVLATAGLATGVGTCEVDVAAPPLPTVEIIPVGTWATQDGPGARLATVAVVDEWGRTISDPDIVWYDEGGAEIGRGRSIDLRELSDRVGAVRAVVLNVGKGRVERTWLTHRTEAGRCVLHHDDQGSESVADWE